MIWRKLLRFPGRLDWLYRNQRRECPRMSRWQCLQWAWRGAVAIGNGKSYRQLIAELDDEQRSQHSDL